MIRRRFGGTSYEFRRVRFSIAALIVVAAAACSSSGRKGELVPAPMPASVWNSPWDGSVDLDPQSRFRPMTGMNGMVVSDDPVASAWGAEILRRGGNAVDAAVATAFALAVTRPHYASLGGGGFLVYCPAGKPCTTIDYRERAPGATGSDFYVGRPLASQDGPLASGVPGVTAGLIYALENFGSLPRSVLLSRPIELAKTGVTISSNSESAAAQRWKAMSPEARRIWGCANVPCTAGTRILQPDLARVLEAISRRGVLGFYDGEVAQKVSQGIRDAGGVITLEDLKTYTVRERAPVTGKYKDAEIITMPPPSAGGTLLLQMFQYVEMADRSAEFSEGAGSSRSEHALLQAMTLAYADRAEYFGDPDFVQVPVSRLLARDELEKKWSIFERNSARIPPAAAPLPAPEGANTTHFSVVDKDGNAVALTTTVNDNFGSGFVPPGTGVVMNNEMDDFVTEPGKSNLYGLVGSKANWVAPGKRPVSSMSPTIVRDSRGSNRIVIGAQGGPRITTGVFQTLFHRLRYGMALPDAMAFGRVHHQWRPLHALYEKNAFAPEVLGSLRARGWEMKETNGVGKLQAIERFENGRVWGVPDPRTEGVAVRE